MLTPVYLEILRALIDLYEETGDRVTSRELARKLGKHEVTVRNALRVLRALNLVSARSGPAGGYEPTMRAYEILESPSKHLELFHAIGRASPSVPLRVNGKYTDLYVTDLELVDLTDPRGSRAIVKVNKTPRGIHPGDIVKIGPLGISSLVVEGIVSGTDKKNNEVYINIRGMLGVPRIRVEEVMTPGPISVRPDATIRDVAKRMLPKGYRAIPVVRYGKIIGVVTTRIVLQALLNGRGDEKVENLASETYYTIRRDEDILTALRMMKQYSTGRLFVLDERGDVIGIVTRTDILERLAGLIHE